jgi:hypothetical protein
MTGPVRRIVGREHELEVLLAALDAVGSAGTPLPYAVSLASASQFCSKRRPVAGRSAGILSYGRPASKPNPSCRSPDSMS